MGEYGLGYVLRREKWNKAKYLAEKNRKSRDQLIKEGWKVAESGCLYRDDWGKKKEKPGFRARKLTKKEAREIDNIVLNKKLQKWL